MLNESLIVYEQYILSLAAQTNATPLPAVPEVFGVRLPPPSECLTAVDFDLIPNKPPPEVKQYDEEVEEVEESESDEDEMEAADIPSVPHWQGAPMASLTQPQHDADSGQPLVAQTPGDVDMGGTGGDEGSDNDDADGLFGEEEEESGDEAMEDVAANGVKRKLVEEDDYD
jgi:hypothetical protein